MKSLLKVLVISLVLCGAVNSVFADLTCYPGIRINSPGSGGGWICWDGFVGDCFFCSDEIIVKG
jgi:hypothetical protein